MPKALMRMNGLRPLSWLVLALYAVGCTQTVGVGSSEPLRATPEALDFGRLRPGNVRELELTVENPSRAMTNVRFSIEGDARGSFSVASEEAMTVPANGASVAKVRFRAGVMAGTEAARVILAVEGGTSVEVPLQGEVASGVDVCGDGVLGGAETCDPVESCPQFCADDGDFCTREVLTGAAASCDVECAHQRITACASGDGCCPTGCTAVGDSDCSTCGNGRLDPGEKCDPAGTCPTSCAKPTACTSATLIGSVAACSAQCTYAPITTCVAGDGCCLPGCTPATDADCGVCGDGVCQAAETCEQCVADCGTPPPFATVEYTCTSGQLTTYQPAKACGDEVVVVGVYEPTDTPATFDRIEVTVNRLTPMTLVLSSYEAVQWIVHPAPGAQIKTIVLAGFNRHSVNLWGNVQLIDRTLPVAGSAYLGCAYEWPGQMGPGSCDSGALVRAAEQLTGDRASLFLGCYQASAFTIN